MKHRNLTIQIFNSFEDETKAESKRRSKQSHTDRMNEFAILQERCWGKRWTTEKIKKTVSFEQVAW